MSENNSSSSSSSGTKKYGGGNAGARSRSKSPLSSSSSSSPTPTAIATPSTPSTPSTPTTTTTTTPTTPTTTATSASSRDRDNHRIENVFVTVGTTEFDQLLSTIDDASAENNFFDSLLRLGCKRFVLQTGKTGTYQVKNIESRCNALGIAVEIFNLKPSLLPYMQAADLVISHCGAGSVLEACSFKTKLVVVVNESLQGNHQLELADALNELKYCFKTYPHTIVSLLHDWSQNYKIDSSSSSEFQLETYPQPDLTAFPKAVDSLFEWI